MKSSQSTYHSSVQLVLRIVILCGFTANAVSQDVWSEADVIRQTLQQYPSVRAASLEVEKMKALQKTAFNPEQPRVTFEFPTDVGAGVEIEQQLAFPDVYLKRGKWLKSKTTLAEEAVSLTRREVVKEVRTVFLEAQLAQARVAYFSTLDSLWRAIGDNSGRLFDAGDINRADLVFSQHKAGISKLARQQASIELNNQLAVLSSYARASIDRVETLKPWEAISDTSALFYFDNYMRQQGTVIDNEMRMLRAQRGPDIIIGYVRASEPDTEFRYRNKVGLTIPLFQSQYTGEIQAAKHERLQVETNRELKMQEANLAALQWRNVIRQTSAAILWYEQTGLSQQAELVDINRRLFNAGEIDYALALRNIADAVELKNQYFDALEMHNKAIIELDYLKGVGDE